MRNLLLVLVAVMAFSFYSCDDNSSTPSDQNTKPDFELMGSFEVGVQPYTVNYDSQKDIFHVFCFGMDANFDGTIDTSAGEAFPSWWSVTSAGTAQKIMDFDSPANFPWNTWPDISNRKIYIPLVQKMQVYDLDDYQMIGEITSDKFVNAVSCNDAYIFLSLREGYNTQGQLAVYDKLSLSKVAEFDGGVNIQKSAPYALSGKNNLALLNEGTENNSTIQFGEISSAGFTSQEITVGNMANSFDIRNDLLAVTVNGPHKLVFIDLQEKAISSEIPLTSEGYDGPRECHFWDSNYIITCFYNGNIEIHDLETKELYQTLNSDGKVESFDFSDNTLVAANAFVLGQYASHNTVTVFKVK